MCIIDRQTLLYSMYVYFPVPAVTHPINKVATKVTQVAASTSSQPINKVATKVPQVPASTSSQPLKGTAVCTAQIVAGMENSLETTSGSQFALQIYKHLILYKFFLVSVVTQPINTVAAKVTQVPASTCSKPNNIGTSYMNVTRIVSEAAASNSGNNFCLELKKNVYKMFSFLLFRTNGQKPSKSHTKSCSTNICSCTTFFSAFSNRFY